jgi:hypothetical protein
MKKIFLLLFLLTSFAMSSVADGEDPGGLPVGVGGPLFDPSHGNDPIPRNPVQPPKVSIDDYTLYINSEHPDYILTLVDEDGEVTYQTFVPASVNVVILPATLTGDFELRLYFCTSYYFYGYISL